MARSRIGIMGGSFNPIHRRHLQIAGSALDEMKLDRVVFVPNGSPPHKLQDLADAKHRFEMTRLAVIPYKKFTISDIEMTRDGVMYTVDTLKLLHRQFPDAEFFCIIGEDTLFELEHWHQPLELFAQCSFAVCMRRHKSVTDHAYVKALEKKGATFQFLTLAPFDISASDIRRQIAQGVLNEALLPPEVCEYIRVMDLYGCKQSPQGARQVYGKLKESLSDSRLLHTMSVAYTANRLARIHSLDVEAGELAGLLHDCAKCMNLHTLQRIAGDRHLALTDTEMHSVALLHGPVGAAVAQTEYGVQNKDVLSAVAAHTTGAVGMSPLDMAVYLADKIEAYRHDIPDLDDIRALAEQNLYQATYRMLQNAKAHTIHTNRTLHPATDEIIQWVYDHMQ